MSDDPLKKPISLREFLAERLQELHPRLQRFVCPVFGLDRDFGIPRPIGSGVLVRILSRSFLTTAAHVLDEDATNTLYLTSKTGFVDVKGTTTRTVAPPSGRKDDRLDVGFIALADSVAVELATRWAFLGPEDLNVNEVLRPQTVRARAPYAFVGCPGSRNNPRPDYKVKLGGAMFSLRPVPAERYAKLGLDPATHIVAEFDRSSLVDRKGRATIGPKPSGMSGGGVWFLGDYPILTGVERPRLVGIGTEWRSNERVLVGVRISVVTAMIAAQYPEIQPILPEAPQFDARVTI